MANQSGPSGMDDQMGGHFNALQKEIMSIAQSKPDDIDINDICRSLSSSFPLNEIRLDYFVNLSRI